MGVIVCVHEMMVRCYNCSTAPLCLFMTACALSSHFIGNRWRFIGDFECNVQDYSCCKLCACEHVRVQGIGPWGKFGVVDFANELYLVPVLIASS